MFYNFRVDQKHCNYLRFMWPDEEMEEVKEYRMFVHLFGATSSPGVATFGLQALADDHADISLTAANFLKSDIYVDDGITSVSTVQEAVTLVKEATHLIAW